MIQEIPTINQVGTKILQEDNEVKIWNMILQPGECSVLHRHDLPYVFTVLSGSTLEVYDEDDILLETLTIKTGDSLSFYIKDNNLITPDNKIVINRLHKAKNIGSTVFSEILVEKKVLATNTTDKEITD